MLELKVKEVLHPNFQTSFMELCALKNGLNGEQKVRLVNLRKKFIKEIDSVKEADLKEEEMDETVLSFDFKKIPAKMVVNQLSADALFWLDSLLETEE